MKMGLWRGGRRLKYLGIDLPRGHIHVLDIVAEFVVARVVPTTCPTSKHLFLLLGLDALGAGRDPTARDSVPDEAVIVTPAVERDKCVIQALALVPFNVQVAQLTGPRRVIVVVGVVNLIRKVGASEHVVVHK